MNGINCNFSWNSVAGADGYKLYYAPPDLSYIKNIDMGKKQVFQSTFGKGLLFM